MSFDLKSTNFNHLIKRNEEPESRLHFDNSDHEESPIRTNHNSNQPSSEKIGEVLYSWEAPEYEVYEKSNRWYVISAVFLIAIIAYALVTNGPIMAVTFILIGIVGYIHLLKDPRIISFALTSEGVMADNQLYAYEDIFSFWIFYEEHNVKIISLHTKAPMLPFVHLPIHMEDPVQLREILMDYIPEIKQDPSLIDALARVLHI